MKLEVSEYAESYEIKAAEREFGIDPKFIRDWKK
jgi:hypothetical protein